MGTDAFSELMSLQQDTMMRTFFVGEDPMRDPEPESGVWWQHLFAGACAGVLSRSLTAPLDRIKIFLQVHSNRQLSGISSCFNHMIQEGGFQSMWRGNGINLLKIAPESAVKFMAYDQIKKIIRGKKSRELILHERFIAGSFAGGFSQTVIYPLEVLKTRLALRKTGQFQSMWHAFSIMYRTEGPRSFYRGYLPNLLGIIPYAGIELAVYETLKKLYAKKMKKGPSSTDVVMVLTCATISSITGQLVTYPLALVRTKLQAQAVIPSLSNVDSTMQELFRITIRDEGIRGLYRGIVANLLKVVPTVSFSFVVYEKCHHYLCNRKNISEKLLQRELQVIKEKKKIMKENKVEMK